jgi:wyosine [tRNA(Phe)-imidazoG37] synthetase (radical SAM superfamily)
LASGISEETDEADWVIVGLSATGELLFGKVQRPSKIDGIIKVLIAFESLVDVG